METPRDMFDRLEHHKLLVIVVAVAIGFCARVYRLDAAGFAEDETNKIFALRSYEHGDFSANAEHPMVMKILCFASIKTASVWNRVTTLHLSEEVALRLPNAAAGALTSIPLLLLTAGLLGFRVGLITALLWALGLDAIWFNRIAKEDTVYVFFMLSAFYLYYRAKHTPAMEASRQETTFALSGAAFGLMLASKYFPHYFGLNALFYTLVGYDSRNNRPLTRAMWARYFAGLVVTFVVFNPAVFFPQTWRYLWKYVNEEFLTHHGYLLMGKLLVNDVLQTPGGNHWYFYLLFIGVKLPLPVLAALVAGVFEIFRGRGEYPASRGYLFLRMMLVFWLVGHALVGVKFLRYTLTLIPVIYMTAAVGTVTLWRALASLTKLIAPNDRFANALSTGLISAALVIAPAFITIKTLAGSYPSLYVNVFGGNRLGYFFPHDEYYDLGARESIQFIAATAPAGSSIVSEIPGVVQYYLERFNRIDIRSRILSRPGFNLNEDRPDFVLLQPGRVYFENRENFKAIEKSLPLVYESVYQRASAASVYSTRRDKVQR